MKSDKIIPGKIDTSREIAAGYIQDADCDDLLDDLAEFVLKNRGQAAVLSKAQIPGDTGVDAIHRY